MIITPATLQSFDPSTWTAKVQPDGALATYLRSVPVSRVLSPALLQAGARVAVLIYEDNNPADALVVGVIASSSGPGAVPDCAACRVFSNAAVSVTNNTQRSIPFTTARFDTLAAAGLPAMWSASVADTVFCRLPGVWQATATVEFTANATGWRVAGILEIASNQLVGVVEVGANAASDSTNLVVSSGAVKLSGTNGGFKLVVNQDSGGALNVDSAAAYTPELSVVQLG